MRLITEVYDQLSIRTEVLEEGGASKKSYFIEGVFAQSEIPNRNKRLYSKEVLGEALKPYNEMVASKRAMGELGHPATPSINLERVSHLVTQLEWSGNDVVGKAKILDTPFGKIAQNFIDEGVSIGVSTRALGQVKLREGVSHVLPGMRMSAIDIVADPSAPDAFVQGLFEGKEWVMENGIWTAKEAEAVRDEFLEAKNIAEAKVVAFTKLFSLMAESDSEHMNRKYVKRPGWPNKERDPSELHHYDIMKKRPDLRGGEAQHKTDGSSSRTYTNAKGEFHHTAHFDTRGKLKTIDGTKPF